ncbi:MucR family transcriptional regulator [Methylobacterium sp. E-045]|uniref:MucR family transcriptional regulator n=1 Tax=Methylobacterium sp. E-045 TaxID=2836575 RepID=UPI001FBC0466|nr:MucR family transcriptional regulator [Methylobacterium sp. E-045]MCJ2131261.1 MucR family transcriptional regulator [Methylobacterium sp. E-045]
MTDQTPDLQPNYVELTADLVAAYVSNNSVPVSALPELLSNVHAAVSGLATGGTTAAAKDKVEKATPAEIKKSITPDHLISFEDGKPYKTLRRHLTLRGLSPETYRAKYGLSPDYPMTSASYSAQRSELARSLGLGQQRNKKAGRPRKAATA